MARATPVAMATANGSLWRFCGARIWPKTMPMCLGCSVASSFRTHSLYIAWHIYIGLPSLWSTKSRNKQKQQRPQTISINLQSCCTEHVSLDIKQGAIQATFKTNILTYRAGLNQIRQGKWASFKQK